MSADVDEKYAANFGPSRRLEGKFKLHLKFLCMQQNLCGVGAWAVDFVYDPWCTKQISFKLRLQIANLIWTPRDTQQVWSGVGARDIDFVWDFSATKRNSFGTSLYTTNLAQGRRLGCWFYVKLFLYSENFETFSCTVPLYAAHSICVSVVRSKYR